MEIDGAVVAAVANKAGTAGLEELERGSMLLDLVEFETVERGRGPDLMSAPACF